MKEKKDQNNPKRVFKEQDDLVVSNKKQPETPDKLLSIRRSEIISIVPDEINWDNVYSGGTGGLHSIKPEKGFPPEKK